jgi:hypothetical protein
MSTAMNIAYESDFVILPAHILQHLFSFCQILKNETLLLVLVDRESVFIYLEPLPAIDAAIRRTEPVKRFNRGKLGQDVLFAYDETKRTLAVCASNRVRRCHLPRVRASLIICDQLQLHVFVFDETFKTLHAQGIVIDLAPWYSQAVVSILQVAFVHDKEDMVLVDSSVRARVFSLITRQFRCGSQYFVLSPPTLLTGLEDRLLCRFRRFPMRYSALLMGHAS